MTKHWPREGTGGWMSDAFKQYAERGEEAQARRS